MSSQAATQNLVQSKYETCAHSLIMHEWQQDVIWKWTCNPSAKNLDMQENVIFFFHCLFFSKFQNLKNCLVFFRSLDSQLFNKANELQEDISLKRFDHRVALLHLAAIRAQVSLIMSSYVMDTRFLNYLSFYVGFSRFHNE